MNELNLTPRRPHLLRAFYAWLTENDLTPHLVVDATLPRVQVPTEFVQDGQIVLNIAPRAVVDLDLTLDEVAFNARFGGVPMQVIVPMYAVMAIYARENGTGTMFEPEPAYAELLEQLATSQALAAVDAQQQALTEDDDDEPPPPRPKGPPSLKVVK